MPRRPSAPTAISIARVRANVIALKCGNLRRFRRHSPIWRGIKAVSRRIGRPLHQHADTAGTASRGPCGGARGACLNRRRERFPPGDGLVPHRSHRRDGGRRRRQRCRHNGQLLLIGVARPHAGAGVPQRGQPWRRPDRAGRGVCRQRALRRAAGPLAPVRRPVPPGRPGDVRRRTLRTRRDRLPGPGRRDGLVRLPAAAIAPRRRSPDRAGRGRRARAPPSARAVDLPRRELQVAGARSPVRTRRIIGRPGPVRLPVRPVRRGW